VTQEKSLTKEAFRTLKGKHDIVVIAPGAQKQRKFPFRARGRCRLELPEGQQ
jgi:hypothetical protein